MVSGIFASMLAAIESNSCDTTCVIRRTHTPKQNRLFFGVCPKERHFQSKNFYYSGADRMGGGIGYGGRGQRRFGETPKIHLVG